MKYPYNDSRLLKTKLQIPHLPVDYILKHQLIEFLNIGIERPFTLVSAGAGFGKSTFISSWLKQLNYKHGWVSLDENDNDFQTFVMYFIAAIQQSFPDFGQPTRTLLITPSLPPCELISNSLINDLNDLPELFLLAFDDIYLINNLEIYKLFSRLLKYPPKNFHLILISRFDPPLPLPRLRAANKIKEIRIPDLQFTEKETEQFVKKHLNIAKTDSIGHLLKKKTEGWVTGLRLSIMHIANNYQREEDIEDYLTNISFTESYFIEEVLEHLDPATEEFLLKTSILDRFCSSLTAYVLSDSDNIIESEKVIARLIKENLFIINLDDENQWFRYHHLFQSLLRKRLRKKYSTDAIDALHRKALEWYEKESYINDAFFHAGKMNGFKETTELIIKHMHKPLNKNRWFDLERWLAKIPDKYIYQNPVLLIAEMWILQHKNMIWLIPDRMKNLEKIKDNNLLDAEVELQMQFFQGVILFWSARIKESLVLFDKVRKNLSNDKIGAISLASIYYATAAQMNGTGEKVYLEYKKKVYGKNINSTYKTILYGSLLYMKLHEGDLFTVERINHQFKKFSQFINNIFAQTWSDYFSGYLAFQQNKPELAYQYFKNALKNVYFLNMTASVDSFGGMLLTLKILHRSDEYKQVYKQLLDFISERNNPVYTTISYSLRARLALLENNITSAVQLMKMADLVFDSGTTQFFIESPRLTYCRVLLSQNDANKTEIAAEKLEKHLALAVKTDNVYQLIRINILRTIAFLKMNEKRKALDSLLIALAKAEPGNWIQPFMEDGGNEIHHLLTKLVRHKKLGKFVSLLLDRFSVVAHGGKGMDHTLNPAPHAILDYTPLTNRELDIIQLLAKRFSNKEIAEKLFISPSTVKRHTINIYQKLGVNKRREAVNKALELNLLS